MTDYVRFTSGGVRWRVAPGFLPSIREGPFSDLDALVAASTVIKDHSAKKLLEYSDGRRSYRIKIYKSRSFWRRLGRLGRAGPARYELELCRTVIRLGISTVPFSGIAEWKGNGAVVCPKLEGAESLESRLSARRDPDLLRRYGSFARKIHDAGLDQDDFNPSNILIRGDELFLIDFERLKAVPRLATARRCRVLAKLIRLRSVGREGLDDFLSGYLKTGESIPDFRRRILDGADRQREIDRRRIRRNCVREGRNFGRSAAGFYRKRGSGLGRIGLLAEEAAVLNPRVRGLRFEPCTSAIEEWKRANERSLDGSEPPLAVLRTGPGAHGFVVYRALRRAENPP